ncbi:hypothetical protein [Nostoc sp.]
MRRRKTACRQAMSTMVTEPAPKCGLFGDAFHQQQRDRAVVDAASFKSKA